MKDSLSIPEARKLVLLSQRLLSGKRGSGGKAATLSAIEHLGYIQIDAISVIQRAHHHTLWNRNPSYNCAHLEQLLSDRRVFEYWSHAAAYLPMDDFRFSLPRKVALARGEQDHWYERDERMMKLVLKRIESEGPLMAGDFEYRGERVGEWKSKPAKRALETLFMQGDLMVPKRVNFQKVYDLTERVLPEGIDTRLPKPEEHARFLITRYLDANGLGQAAEMAYLLKGMKPRVTATLKDMVANGELLQLEVDGVLYHAVPGSMERLERPLYRSRLKILSPFDNLVIQRKRMKALFGFDYLIECYVPKAKRRYGYFSLPILWDGKLVARMDCKAERKESCLHVHNVVLESPAMNVEAFFVALRSELEDFLKFNQCQFLKLHRVSPAKLKAELKKVLQDLNG